jgi:hypothetical protein
MSICALFARVGRIFLKVLILSHMIQNIEKRINVEIGKLLAPLLGRSMRGILVGDLETCRNVIWFVQRACVCLL